MSGFGMNTWQGQEVSAEVMGRLARLMATENISIEHHSVGTAAFDVLNRVLYLPNWKNMSRDLYNLFVVHEVGHALHTPADALNESMIGRGQEFKNLVNILDDCRIEKKQKRRFPGAAPQMEAGYAELLAANFFGTRNRDINSYGFMDRLNIHAKCGESLNIQFTAAEAVLVNRAMETETFDEMMALAEELWNREDTPPTPEDNSPDDEDDDETAESAPESDDTQSGESDAEPREPETLEEEIAASDDMPSIDEPEPQDEPGDESSGSGDNHEEDEQNQDVEDSASADTDGAGDEENEDDTNLASGEGEGDEEVDASEDADGESNTTGREGSKDADPVSNGADWDSEKDTASETADAAEAAMEQFTDRAAESPSYVQVGKDDTFCLDRMIIPNDEIASLIETEFANSYGSNVSQFKAAALEDLKSFKSTNKKAINFLVKEFEMRKAAAASQRAATATTGVIDPNKLASYKWNDNIFKKITNVAEGKSHGLVMFVDWSGSMQANMRGTIEQLITLVLFCDRVNIPFDVYGFTDAYTGCRYFNRAEGDRVGSRQKNLKRGDFKFFDCNLNLLHIATSNTKSKAAKSTMFANLMVIRGHFANRRHVPFSATQKIHAFPLPSELNLGGTPLSETIITAIPIVNKFRKDNALEIVHTIFLTDGSGCDLRDAENTDYNYGNTHVRRENRTTTKIGSGNNAMPQMNILIDVLRERTKTTVSNLYICNPTDGAFKCEIIDAENDNKEHGQKKNAQLGLKAAKLDGGYIVRESSDGWDYQALIMGGKHLTVKGHVGMSVGANAKKKELTKAFAEAGKAKLKCRVVLKEFIKQIAE